MTPPPSLAVCTEERPDCARQFAEMREWLQRIDEEQRTQGKMLSALDAKVAVWAAVGAIAGGGLVTAFSRLLK